MRGGPLLLAVLIVAASCPSQAQTRIGTCTHVKTEDPADAPGLRKLVTSEVDRHNTHHSVDEGCTTHLVVEVFRVGGERYLTARIGAEVPYRVRVAGTGTRELEQAVEEALTVVLHNDPVRLRGPETGDGLSVWLGTMRRRGLTVWGVQLAEMGVYANGALLFVPGLGLTLGREAGAWQIAIGATVGADMQGPRSEVRLSTLARVEAQLTYYLSEETSSSWYVTGSFGLLHQRFEGPLDAEAGGRRDEQSAAGAAIGLRTGVELLRETDARMQLYVEGLGPLYATTNEDVPLVTGWVPAMGGGVGVVF